MSTIQRFDVGARLSDMAVHGGVAYLAGQVPADATQDVTGQTAQVLAAIDALLECGRLRATDARFPKLEAVRILPFTQMEAA